AAAPERDARHAPAAIERKADHGGSLIAAAARLRRITLVTGPMCRDETAVVCVVLRTPGTDAARRLGARSGGGRLGAGGWGGGGAGPAAAASALPQARSSASSHAALAASVLRPAA